MHEVQRRQVLHPRGDLHGHVEEVRQAAGGEGGVSEEVRARDGTPAPAAPPDGGDVVGVRERALDLALRQEHVQVSVLHVLGDHAERVGRHAHAQQPDDVGVVQPRHDLDLLQEVVPDWWKHKERADVAS